MFWFFLVLCETFILDVRMHVCLYNVFVRMSVFVSMNVIALYLFIGSCVFGIASQIAVLVVLLCRCSVLGRIL